MWSPHVIKVDQTYKMWFTADQYGGLRRIGYAELVDGINWTKHPEPVIEKGDPDVFLYYTESPTVSFDGEKYHMWYSRENEDLYHQIDYAVSSNGISWSKHPENPVTKTGADSDWYRAIYHPNVIMNNDKMWFVGGRGDWKFGYAEDFSNLVHADSVIIETYVKPNSDPFNILGRILSPEGHALTAKAFILSDDENSKDSVELFDDGSNNDGAAGDGIYGGYWPVADEKNYNVGIKTVD